MEQCCNYSKQCRNDVATLCCAKNRRCESFRVKYEDSDGDENPRRRCLKKWYRGYSNSGLLFYCFFGVFLAVAVVAQAKMLAMTTKTSLKKWIRAPFSFNSSNGANIFLSWILKDCTEVQFVVLCWPPPTKLEISHFHVESCSVQKSVMHLQSCCFQVLLPI